MVNGGAVGVGVGVRVGVGVIVGVGDGVGVSASVGEAVEMALAAGRAAVLVGKTRLVVVPACPQAESKASRRQRMAKR
jgi:hypothetical protein